METKEFEFKGMALNGFLMLFVVIVLPFVLGWCFYESIMLYDQGGMNGLATCLLVLSIVMLLAELFCLGGFFMVEPNTARVTTWFGKYSGTFTQTGYHWINPFYSKTKVSMRARNLDAVEGEVGVAQLGEHVLDRLKHGADAEPQDLMQDVQRLLVGELGDVEGHRVGHYASFLPKASQ